MPEVLEVINVPGLRNFSTFSKTCFLISSLSTTTSMIQSQAAISFILSSKLPVVIFFTTSFVKTGEGLLLKRLPRHHLQFYFVAIASLGFCGVRSNIQQQNLQTNACKMTAIRLPITPLPKTATFLIVLFCIHKN